MINETMKKFGILMLILLPIAFFCYVVNNEVQLKRAVAAHTTVSANSTSLRTFTAQELAQYDGTDPNKPIYIGMNGKVYDVTAGKNYYDTNGVYHFLAGKDSSAELNLIGGDIIARKYPVVGVLQ